MKRCSLLGGCELDYGVQREFGGGWKYKACKLKLMLPLPSVEPPRQRLPLKVSAG